MITTDYDNNDLRRRALAAYYRAESREPGVVPQQPADNGDVVEHEADLERVRAAPLAVLHGRVPVKQIQIRGRAALGDFAFCLNAMPGEVVRVGGGFEVNVRR